MSARTEVALVSTPVAPRPRVTVLRPRQAPSASPAPVATKTHRRPSRLTLVVVLITLVGLVLRVQRLRFGLAHEIVDYDEGVYFGSSLSLVDGRLPYRDFVFVHPPLISIALAPLALLAKLTGTAAALGLATVATGLAGAASVPLAARLVRHRGPIVVVPVALLVALHGDAVASSYTVLLEPWLVLLCLLGVNLVFRRDQPADGRRLLLGGVLLGLACATKIWAIVPVFAVLLVCLPDTRRVLRLMSGVAVGFLVPVLPFAVFAPGRFLHEVFVVQLLRAPALRTENTFRVLHLFSVSAPDGELPQHARSWLVAAGVVVLIGGLAVVTRTIGRGTPLDRFAVLAAVLVVAMLFVPGTFYWHYAAFAAPFLALAITLPLSHLGRRAARSWTSVLALCVVGLAVGVGHRVADDRRGVDEHRAFAAAVPAGSCVIATMSSMTIADDRFETGTRCPQLVDSFGTALAYSDGRQPSSDPPRGERIARVWLSAVRLADFVYVDHRDTRTLPADPDLRRYLRTHFVRVDQPGLAGTLYERVSPPRR